MKRTFLFPICMAIALWGCDDSAGPEPATPVTAAPPGPVPDRTTTTLIVERIDGDIYKVGTIDRIRELEDEAIGEVRAHQTRMLSAADDGFRTIFLNIESYLDWYYLLPQRPTVLIHMVQDGLNPTMSKRLQNELKKGDPFAPLARELAQLRHLNTRVAVLSSKRKELLAQNRHQRNLTGEYEVRQETTTSHLTDGSDASVSKVRTLAHLGAALRKPPWSFSADTVARKVIVEAANAKTFMAAPKEVSFAGAVELARSPGAAAAGTGIGVLIGAFTGGTVGAVAGVVARLLMQVAANKLPPDLSTSIRRSDYRNDIQVPLRKQEKELRAKINAAFKEVLIP